MTPNERNFLDKFLRGITYRSAFTILSVLCTVAFGAFKLYNQFDKRLTIMETKQEEQYKAIKEQIEGLPQCHCNGQHQATYYGTAGVLPNH